MTTPTPSDARRRAQDDYRAEGGLDSNPFDKAAQAALYEAYSWEMHRLQMEELRELTNPDLSQQEQ